MPSDVWTPINAIVTSVGAIAAVAAAWVGILVYRKQRENEFPVVSATLETPQMLAIVVENITTSQWTVETLVIREPAGLRGNLWDRLTSYDEYGAVVGPSEEDLRTNLFGPTIPIGRVVYPAGSSSSLGRGDLARLTFHLSGSTSRPVSMRLNLASNDAVRRRKAYPIKRTPIAVAKIETD